MKLLVFLLVLLFTCSIASADLYLDFDSETAIRTESGYTSFILAEYDSGLGYGWLNEDWPYPNRLRDFVVPDDNLFPDLDGDGIPLRYKDQVDLFRDCHQKDFPVAFVVDLEPGYYLVSLASTLHPDDTISAFRAGKILIEGNLLSERILWPSESYEEITRGRWFSYPVEVTDGQLTIEFGNLDDLNSGMVSLCGLEITSISRPNIAGVDTELIHGSPMSITGNGFGSKELPITPMIWENFEDGVEFEEIHNVKAEWIDYRNQGYSPAYTSVNTYAGDLAVWNHLHYGFNTAYRPFEEESDIYVSYKYFWHSEDDIPGGAQKPTRITSINDYNGNTYHGTGSFAYVPMTGAFVLSLDESPGTNNKVSYSVDETVEDAWLAVEMFTAQSTPGQYDGFASFSLDGTLFANDVHAYTMGVDCFDHTSECVNSCIYDVCGGPGYANCIIDCNQEQCQSEKVVCDYKKNNIILGTMWDQIGDNDVYIDDLYVDNTQARVVICDVDNWGDITAQDVETRCEIQIPQNVWDDENIEFEVNLGAFTQDDLDAGLYLFVVDADGFVSDGFGPLSADGSVDPPVSSLPGDLNDDDVVNLLDLFDVGSLSDLLLVGRNLGSFIPDPNPPGHGDPEMQG